MTEIEALDWLETGLDLMRRSAHGGRCPLGYRCLVEARVWLSVEAATLALDALKGRPAPAARHKKTRRA